MPSKRITGLFATRESGQQAVQALLQRDIAPEQLYLFAGARVAAEDHNDNARPGESASAVVGAGLTGLVTFVVPGMGILLGAATAVAARGITAASSDEVANDRSSELEHMLVKL